MTNNIVTVTEGSGKNIATETIGTTDYQKIKVVGGETGSTSVMGVTPDGSIKVSIIGVPTFLVGGSIAAVVTSNPNQSVSGAVTHPPGSVSAVRTDNASVIAVVQNSSFIGIVQGSVTAIPTGNQSVSGATTAPPGSVTAVRTDNASVIAVVQNSSFIGIVQGSVTAIPTGNQSVSGTVNLGLGTTTIGSVTVMQGTNPFVITGSVQGTLSVNPGSVSGAVTFPPGSVAAVRTDNASVIAVFQNSSIIGIVQGSVTAIPTGNQSVSGAITFPPGSIATMVNPAGSVTGVRTDNASVITLLQNSSIISINAGSVFTVPMGSTIAVLQSSSIISINAGSVIAIMGNTSIAGTFSEDAAHTSADKGLFALGVRNDVMVSVTSADLDYSQVSTGPVGEVLTANSPINKWFAAQASVMYGVSVQAVAAPGTSIFNYLSGIQVINDSATYSRVKVTGGLGSVLAWMVAPGNGGDNMVFPNPIKVGENSGISVSINGISSVYVNMQGFTAKI